MKDIWINRLSEYLDGELDNAERAALEAHLATCGQCYATLGELRQVIARAQALQDTPPANELWPEIRARMIEESGTRLTPARRPAVSPRRRFSFSVPQLLAASVALVLLSSGGVWMALRPPAVAVTPRPGTAMPGTPITPVTWTSPTDLAVVELQDALARNESRLDTATVRVVRQNLAVIDRAIAEARAALQNDPANTYLNLHLADTMRRKVELLRRINALVAES